MELTSLGSAGGVFERDTDELLNENSSGMALDQSQRNLNKGSRCSHGRTFRVIVVASVVFAVAVTVALVTDIYFGVHPSGHGAVASDVKECSDIGLHLLKIGGSAVDAAIGTLICAGVMNPEGSGIGGGGFMLVKVPRGKPELIDFRETAPAAAHKDMFKENFNESRVGPLSIAVPGEMRGFELAHKKYGKLKWSQLIEPSVKIARDGFLVKSHTVKALQHQYIRDQIKKSSLSDIFAPGGKLLKTGDKLKNPLLATTLEKIASEGADAFYSGDIAQSIVDAVQEGHDRKGILTLNDLANYTAVVRESLNTTYHGYQIIATPPPTGGAVLLSILNIVEGFNFTKNDLSKNTTYQFIVEAFKYAFAQRSHLADPAFVNLTKVISVMKSKAAAARIREAIHSNRTYNNVSHYGPFFDQEPTWGTTHVSVQGPDGEVVSATSSVNFYFGSMVMTKTGIILNDGMDDFSNPHHPNIYGVRPSKANFIEPGKRPQSSITPVVVLHKQDRCGFRLALGASGGTRIITSVTQTLLNLLSFGMSLSQAIERARFHHQLLPNVVEAKDDKLQQYQMKGVLSYLKSVGHRVSLKPVYWSSVVGVENYHDTLSAHSDSRRAGSGASTF